MEKINLKQFEKKIVVRPLRLEDYDQLVELEKKCFPGMLTWKKEQVENHIKTFPEGQLVVEYKGRIVASSSSLIIDFDEYLEGHSWHEISDSGYISNHSPEGDTLYGIEIMVDPEFRGKFAQTLDAFQGLGGNPGLEGGFVAFTGHGIRSPIP